MISKNAFMYFWATVRSSLCGDRSACAVTDRACAVTDRPVR